MNELDVLKQIITESENMVFFGGAGVSTESNIPDFRSETGLYNAQNKYGYRPETILSHSFFQQYPQQFFDYHLNEMIYEQAQPNDAHRALAALEQQGKLQAVITQNIDGLHQRAGSKNVLELHGSVLRNYCTSCGAKYTLEFMVANRGAIPHCSQCGGIVRPDIVLYEENLDSRLLERAQQYIEAADTLIVGGTSLAVYPAAGLINFFGGRKLVLLNKSVTVYDSEADLIVRESIGKALKYSVFGDE